MFLLRVKEPIVRYSFGRDKRTILYLSGSSVYTLYPGNGVAMEGPFAVIISTGIDKEPYEVGSFSFEEAIAEDPARVDVGLHASVDEIGVIYEKCTSAKYSYISIDGEASPDDDGTWRIQPGNRMRVLAWSFRAGAIPSFDDTEGAL